LAKTFFFPFNVLTKIAVKESYNRGHEKEREEWKMKKAGWKQFVLGVVGALLCRVGILGCYPLIPSYFAAVYLEESGRNFLSIGMLVGLVAFLPVTAVAKYGMSMLFIVAVIRLSEWVDKRCFTAAAALAASGGTLALSVFGGIFDMKNQVSVLTAVLEAVFIFGFVILAARGVHMFLEEKELPREEEYAMEGYQEQKLLNYAKSFEGLAHTFLSMSKKTQFSTEEVGRMQAEITGNICSCCDTCAVCWEPANHTMYHIFRNLFQGFVKNGSADSKAAEELESHCRYAKHVEAEALHVFERASVNRAWYNRLLENREVIAQQLDAMAFIMQDCASESRLLDREEKNRLAEIRYRGKECGIVIEEIHLYEKNDGHKQIQLKTRSRWGNCIAVKQLTKAISGIMECNMHPHKEDRTFIGRESMELTYEEEPPFHTISGVAKFTKDGAAVSGDNFSLLEKESGECVLSLSDGMGSGVAACKESETVVELLEKFIEAGFTKETAIKMLNSAMVLRGADESYSTVDMASVNLYTGVADFYKIGAAATFLRHKNGEVECLLSTSLPVGVCCEMEIWKDKRQLCNGDFLVMVTDGVLEYLNTNEPEEKMAGIIQSITTNHPGLMAKKILECVMEETGGAIPDDMTVLSAALWEKS